jgi:hypothetical protein
MRKAVKTPIAGAAAAILLLPLLGGVATSQSTAVNDQVQTGDVSASQTFDVDTVTDQTTGASTATGNAFSGAVQGDALDVQSTQSAQGNVGADLVINVNTDIGQATQATTAATGNTGEADALGGALTGNYSQDAGPVLVRSNNQIEAGGAEAGDISASATAYANVQGLGTDAGSIDATVVQTSSATVEADGGANVQYSGGTAAFSSTAVSNDITVTGTGGSSLNVNLSQTTTGDHTQATKFVAFGNGQTVSNDATASADNIAIDNQGDQLNVVSLQDNSGYVRAQAETTAYEFGQASSSASGVGNSMVARENGASLVLSNSQFNSGAGVEVIATSGGNTGYDLSASATAMGNAVTGFACTLCGGRMSVNNTQSNTADIGARSTVSVDGSARSVTGIATAVGNSATFYVSKPGN